MNMLTYECVFGEKGMDADCELEWERKTIEGNVCIRLAPSPFAAFGPPGSLDKWQEEVEEQFVWPGRPALLPDGRLCVPTLEGLQIVAPAEEIKCFPNSKKMLKDQGRWGGEEKEWPVEGADAAGRRAIRASRVYQTLNRPTCVVVSPGGAVFVLEGGKDYPYGQTTPAALKKFSWSEGKMELQGAAEGLELSAYKGDLALGKLALYVLDGLKVPPLNPNPIRAASHTAPYKPPRVAAPRARPRDPQAGARAHRPQGMRTTRRCSRRPRRRALRRRRVQLLRGRWGKRGRGDARRGSLGGGRAEAHHAPADWPVERVLQWLQKPYRAPQRQAPRCHQSAARRHEYAGRGRGFAG